MQAGFCIRFSYSATHGTVFHVSTSTHDFRYRFRFSFLHRFRGWMAASFVTSALFSSFLTVFSFSLRAGFGRVDESCNWGRWEEGRKEMMVVVFLVTVGVNDAFFFLLVMRLSIEDLLWSIVGHGYGAGVLKGYASHQRVRHRYPQADGGKRSQLAPAVKVMTNLFCC